MKYVIDSNTLTDIADAIREEGFTFTEHPEIYTEDMANRIRTLQTGELPIGENGVFSVKGIASVDVNVPSYPEPTDSTNITENGTYNVKDFAEAIVNVSGGGGQTFPFEIKSGEITFDTDTYAYRNISGESDVWYSINHGLSGTPDLFVMWQTSTRQTRAMGIEFIDLSPLLQPNTADGSRAYRISRIGISYSGTGVLLSRVETGPTYAFPCVVTDETSVSIAYNDGNTAGSNARKAFFPENSTYNWIAIKR